MFVALKVSMKYLTQNNVFFIYIFLGIKRMAGCGDK